MKLSIHFPQCSIPRGSSHQIPRIIGLIRPCLIPLLLLLPSLAGCRRENMADQPRYNPLEPSTFYPDHMSARPLVEGTVSREGIRSDAYLFLPTAESPTFPADFPASGDALRLKLDRGRERYTIYCSVCHGDLGDGNGMIVQRGFMRPPSLQLDRLRQAPPGHLFNVITNSFGAMHSYASRVSTTDRWAIIAYVRALQMSQGTRLADLPADDQLKVNAVPAQSPPATAPLNTGAMPYDSVGQTIR